MKNKNKNRIFYLEGYKYQLFEDYFHVLPYNFDEVPKFELSFIKFQPSILTIKKGYAWDGASGIAIDTKNFMRGSLVHDALYQCMRLGKIPVSYRKLCDEELKKIIREDGMGSIRSNYVYDAVRIFGENSAIEKKKILTAP